MLVALVVLAPLLRPGVVLAYDLVIPPGSQPFSAADLGLGSALPRAVPEDAVVAALTAVLPGWLLQRLVLGGILIGAAVGAARVTPTASQLGRCTAALAYSWNPYVAERLLLGQWGLLVGYAALPFVARAALGVRAAAERATAGLLLAVGVASLTPTGGVLAVVLALAVAGRRGGRVAGLLLLLQAPWLVPAVLHPAGVASDPAGVAAFAVRGENWAGVPGAVLSLGGIWNAQVVPGSRTTVVAPLLAAALLAVAAVGLPAVVGRWGRGPATGLLAVAGGGLLLAVLGAVPGLAAALRWAVTTVPGAGLLRDGQKWLAPLALLLAVCVGPGVEELAARPRASLLAVLALLLPVAAVPDLAFGGDGRLRPVHYPADWQAVRRLVDGRVGGGGDLVSLPFASYRAYEWNGNRPSLDPAPRELGVPVITDDRLLVGGTLLAGEDRRARAVGRALAQGSPVGALGVRWVLVQHRTPGAVPLPATQGADLVHDGSDLSLWRVRDVRPVHRDGPPVVPVVAADLAALAVLGGAAAALARRRPARAEVAP